MSIQETTKAALCRLFPDQEPDSPPIEPAGEETEANQAPRRNTIVDQDYATRGFHLDVQLAPEQLPEAARIMFDLGYFLEAITGVDWPTDDQLEAVYDFSRYDFELCRVAIKTRVARNQPHLPTITSVYTGANWHEREAHDFFGIVFDGHPHLIPLLLPEDADFHPLLKDFHA
ncbi:NADH-quinone oxidoreductase subunit C [Desulfofustis glycolicus]|uniref:NADH-quinone oxidoreductase subunit C n=1 Tax=Desulfofustis glycolicus DSM 9705 TaxID=1121409 RepID=A0A1M5VTT2_9BACT|nr:NADH-quinone oxidoreductase subunit C [Desulfofustis glycolicus]MCB2216697.1 NADH-quinone oxidoreductase subunit C [Desulfobulbaceae bacterium]SHH78689.1 NADH-quinone oxidoreductase subunit C [Desulfofustis glycolicus DSM 9705]